MSSLSEQTIMWLNLAKLSSANPGFPVQAVKSHSTPAQDFFEVEKCRGNDFINRMKKISYRNRIFSKRLPGEKKTTSWIH